MKKLMQKLTAGVVIACCFSITPSLAQDTLTNLMFNTGTQEYCKPDQVIVSAPPLGGFTVEQDANVTIKSNQGITLKPGFSAGNWNAGGGFLGKIDGSCREYLLYDGVFSPNTAIPEIDINTGEYYPTAYDRFGNSYSLSEIAHGSCTPDWTTEEEVNNVGGMFNLSFCTDGIFDPFDVNTVNTIVEVFEDIALLITPQQCGANPTVVNIQITAPPNDAQNTPFSNGLEPGTLGAASQFYIPEREICTNIATESSGIIYGQVWQAINTGEHDQNLMDGQIAINFANYSYNSNYPLAPSSNEADLYSVMLHEVLHCLGFASLLRADGQSWWADQGINIYSRFDTHVHGGGGNVVNWNLTNLYDPFTNNAVTLGQCDMSFNGFYTATDLINSDGRYSHFSLCNGVTQRVMEPGLALGDMRRQLTDDDVNVLLDLGYEITGNFPPNSPNTTPIGDLGVISIDDGVTQFNQDCATELQMELCEAPNDHIQITDAELIANDINTNAIEGFEVIGGTGALQLNGPGVWDFFPSQGGVHRLRYTPVQQPVGNTNINVNTVGNSGCVTIEVFSCDPLGTCFEPSPCDLICNPGFTYPNGPTTFCALPDYFGPCSVPSWEAVLGTPDWVDNNPLPPNPGAMQMGANSANQFTESVVTSVNVIANQRYTFSYIRRQSTNPNANPISHSYVRLTNDAALNGAGLPVIQSPILPNPLPANQLILDESNIANSQWERVTVCFTADANYDRLWIYPEQDPGAGWTMLLVDEVHLIPDDFTAGLDQIGCGNVTLGPTSPVCELDDVSYLWNPGGETTQQITANVNQTTTFNVTRSYPPNPNTVVLPVNPDNCTIVDDVTVVVNDPIQLDVSFTDDGCGSCTGTANVDNIINGVGPFSYLWEEIPSGNVPSITSNADELCAGTYNLIVTDQNGCTGEAQVQIGSGNFLDVDVSNTNACDNQNNGSITITPNGGTSPITYTWDPAVSTANSATGLSAGTYTITVADANGCSTVETVIIDEADELELTVTGSPSCANPCNGSANATATGGSGNYTYEWEDANGTIFSSVANPSGLCAGTYTVTVTDDNNCEISGTVTIGTHPLYFAAISATPSNEICPGEEVTLTALPTNNGWDYVWGPNGETTASIVVNQPGNYTVAITNNNGCISTPSINITPGEGPVVTITATNVSCDGTVGGTATAVVTGGTSPYTYQWFDQGGAIPNSNMSSISGLAAGTYTVVVNDDANGCETTATIDILEYDELQLTVSGSASCAVPCNGSADATATGGSGNYTYEWEDGNGNVISNASSLSGLCADTYTVTVTDANNCTATEMVTIVDYGDIVLDVSKEAVNGSVFNYGETVVYEITVCNYSDHPVNDISITDNVPSEFETINPGDFSTPVNNTITAVISNLDVNACTTLTFSAVVSETICNEFPVTNCATAIGYIEDCQSQPFTACEDIVVVGPIINVTVSGTDNCSSPCNGTATASATGGTLPHTYAWYDSNGTLVSNTETASGLCSGNYTVTVTDANGCQAPAAIHIDDFLFGLPPVTTTDVNCFGECNGSASVDISSIPGATMDWFGNGVFSVWTTLPGQCAGNYEVIVQAPNGCTETLPYTINEPAELEVSVQSTDVGCFGADDGTITITASGGTSPITYTWDPAVSTANSATGLSAGTYTITVADANGCSTVETVIIEEADELELTVTGSPSCANPCNGSANATVTGGSGNYTYEWEDANGTIFSSVANPNGLCAGTYTVTVTDDNNCEISGTVTIGTHPLYFAAISASPSNEICPGEDVTLSALPSNNGFGYVWGPNGETTTSIVVNQPGNYTVSITNTDGCITVPSINITLGEGPTVAITGTNVSCDGTVGGTATAVVTGGTSPYTYQWFDQGGAIPNSNVSSISGLSGGTYTVVVNDDANGCEATATIEIFEYDELEVDIAATMDCQGNGNGEAVATATGGLAPYSYSWSNNFGLNSATNSGLAAGTYTVTVTDYNDCEAIETVTIIDPSNAVIKIDKQATNGSSFAPGDWVDYQIEVCNASSYVLTNVLVQDLLSSDFDWSQVSTTDFNQIADLLETTIPQLEPVGTPGYCVILEFSVQLNTGMCDDIVVPNCVSATGDIQGCQLPTFTACTDIAVSGGNLSVTASASASCWNPSCTGSANAIVSGGSGNYTYTWVNSNGIVVSTLQNPTGLCGGSYTVTVTDQNTGCQASTSVYVFTYWFFNWITASPSPVICAGEDVTLTAFPSNSNYTYLWSANGETTGSIVVNQPGTYTVSITNGNGCVVTPSITITAGDGPTVTVSATNGSCNNTGVATATVTGGTPPYTYEWFDQGGAIPNSNVSSISGLAAGTYTVVVNDAANGCEATASVDIIDGNNLEVSMETTVDCQGAGIGQAIATPIGGTPQYSYSWSNDLTLNNPTNSGLTAGTYTVTITDAIGCTITETVEIIDPSQAYLKIRKVALNGPTFSPGQTVDYLIEVCNPNSFAVSNVTVEDILSSEFDWSTVVSTDFSQNPPNGNTLIAQIPQLEPAGVPGFCVTFTFSVQLNDNICGEIEVPNCATANADVQGCQLNSSTNCRTIVVNGSTIDLTVTGGLSCFNPCNGSASVSIGGVGTAPYDIVWTDVNGNVVSNAANATDLCGGYYIVTVTDATGCVATEGVTVYNQVPFFSAIMASPSSEICPGEDVTLEALPVNSSFSYEWGPNGETTQSIVVNQPGNYTVTVTNAGGCIATPDIDVTIGTGPDVVVTSTDVTCNGIDDGTATATASGGTAPYNYEWFDGSGTPIASATTSSPHTVTGLSADSYTVVVTDAVNGCETVVSVDVMDYDDLEIEFNPVVHPCFGGPGSATAVVTGGVPPYSYLWDDPSGQTDAVLDFVAPGIYTVIVTDDAGCTVVASVEIHDAGNPDLLTVTKTVVNGTTFYPGDVVQYEVEVCNNSGDMIDNVTVTDVLPSPLDQGGVTSNDFTQLGSTLTAQITQLPPGCTTLAFEVIIPDDVGFCEGVVTNCADATGYLDDCLIESEEHCVDITILGDNYTAILSNTTLTNGGLPNGYYADEVWSVDGLVVVDHNVILDNCKLHMQPNAVLMVLPGVELSITNYSHLFACDTMWGAIWVQGTGTVNVVGESIVEDAQFGVFINPGANYEINHAHFNKNRVHVLLGSFGTMSGVATGDIINSTFTCGINHVVGSPYTDLLPPFAGEQTLTGVENTLNQVVTVGGTMQGNHFETADFGIRSVAGDIVAKNNTFKAITSTQPDQFSGTCILARGTQNLTVDDENTFIESLIGVLAFDQTDNVDVINNTFNGVLIGIGALPWTQAITAPNKDIHIADNTMTAPMWLGVACIDNPQATILVEDNDIGLDFILPTTGINIMEASPLSGAAITAEVNEVSNARTGINLANAIVPVIQDNEVDVIQTGNGLVSSGIQVDVTLLAFVLQNHVSGGATYNDTWRRGITFGLGLWNIIRCNTTIDIGWGLHFGGQLEPSFVLQNRMENNHTGLVLENGTLGMIGQDLGGGLFRSWDNTWHGTHVNHTWSINSPGASYPLYHRPYDPTGIFTPTVNPGNTPFDVQLGSPGEDMKGELCPDSVGSPQFIVGTDPQDALVAALNNSNTGTYAADRDWIKEANIYTHLSKDQTLLNGNVTLTDFYNTSDNSNIGTLVRASEALATRTNMNEHLYLLNNMTTSLLPEEAWKDVLVIAIEKALDETLIVDGTSRRIKLMLQQMFPAETFDDLMVQDPNWSASQEATLIEIAELCPYNYGQAVYMARALLARVPSINGQLWEQNPCELESIGGSSRYAEQQAVVTSDDMIVDIYPNPTSGIITVDVIGDEVGSGEIMFYSVSGALVESFKLSPGKNTLDVSSFSVGMYQYTVVIDGQQHAIGKQVISK